MLDSYRTATSPEHRHYIQHARYLRSRAFHTALRAAARAVVTLPRTVLRRLRCRHVQHRAAQQLKALSGATLKDIGLARGEISWRVREALPCS